MRKKHLKEFDVLLATAIIAQEIGCPSRDVEPGRLFRCIDRNRPDSAGKRDCFCENAARRVLLEVARPQSDYQWAIPIAWITAGTALIIAAVISTTN